MGSQFVIEETWMEHKGGSKFYHPIRLMRMTESGSVVITAIHFAGFGGDLTKFRRPVNGGQVQIKEDVYHKQIAAKQRGGYTVDGLRGPTRYSVEAAFRAKVIHMFGGSKSDEIFAKLGLRMGGEDAVLDPTEEELRPKPPGEDTSAEDFTERPEAWGSW